MKIVTGVLLALLLCVMASGCRKGSGNNATADPTQSATKFVTLLSSGKYGAAVNMLEPSLKSITPAARLKDTWQANEKIYDSGAFQGIKGAKLAESTESENSPKSVAVTCRFAKKDMTVLVALNVDQKVMNWSMIPSDGQAKPSGTPDPPKMRTGK